MTIPDPDVISACQWRLDALHLGDTTTVHSTLAALQRHRGRPVQLVVDDPAGLVLPSGMWMQFHDRDVIWVDRRTSPMHRFVIIGHEAGHMLCEHDPAPIPATGPTEPVRILADQQLGLRADQLAAIMGRCGNAAADADELRREREAEIIGRILAQRFMRSCDPDEFVGSLAEL